MRNITSSIHASSLNGENFQLMFPGYVSLYSAPKHIFVERIEIMPAA